jgi:hypothetical protein
MLRPNCIAAFILVGLLVIQAACSGSREGQQAPPPPAEQSKTAPPPAAPPEVKPTPSAPEARAFRASGEGPTLRSYCRAKQHRAEACGS